MQSKLPPASAFTCSDGARVGNHIRRSAKRWHQTEQRQRRLPLTGLRASTQNAIAAFAMQLLIYDKRSLLYMICGKAGSGPPKTVMTPSMDPKIVHAKALSNIKTSITRRAALLSIELSIQVHFLRIKFRPPKG